MYCTFGFVIHVFTFLIMFNCLLLTRSDASLRTNIANILWAKRVAFARSDITRPEVNRFGWNLEHCEPNVGGWPWQILGMICAKPKFCYFAEVNIRTLPPISRRTIFTTFQHNNVNRWGSDMPQLLLLNYIAVGFVAQR